MDESCNPILPPPDDVFPAMCMARDAFSRLPPVVPSLYAAAESLNSLSPFVQTVARVGRDMIAQMRDLHGFTYTRSLKALDDCFVKQQQLVIDNLSYWASSLRFVEEKLSGSLDFLKSPPIITRDRILQALRQNELRLCAQALEDVYHAPEYMLEFMTYGLKLQPTYLEAVWRALVQRRWEKADYPFLYVRKVAQIEYRKIRRTAEAEIWGSKLLSFDTAYPSGHVLSETLKDSADPFGQVEQLLDRERQGRQMGLSDDALSVYVLQEHAGEKLSWSTLLKIYPQWSKQQAQKVDKKIRRKSG